MILRYTQNFLVKDRLVELLVKKAGLKIDDIVYDLGSGNGNISEILSPNVSKVFAIELDKTLFEASKDKLYSYKNITILNEDLLKFEYPKNSFKVFSNIPFSITTDLVKKLLTEDVVPDDVFLIMQKEASDRFLGLSKQGVLLSLLISSRFETTEFHVFSRDDFYPAPSVDIVMFRAKKRLNALLKDDDFQDFKKFLTYCIDQQKPTLKVRTEKLFTYEQLKRLSKSIGFSLDVKASEVDVYQWVKLYEYFKTGVSPEKKQAAFKD